MNKDGGFIKIYRSMLEWEWHDEPLTVATWMYCLMRANWEVEKWHGEIIKPGQFVTSLAHMAKDIGISKSQLRTALKHLKLTHNVTQSLAQHATLITIEKWGDYQSAGEKVAQSIARHVTSRSHVDSTSIATIEEYKEDKEIKKRESIEREVPVIPDEKTVKFKDGEEVHYINGVRQYSLEESREIMKTAHEGWLETKRRLGMS